MNLVSSDQKYCLNYCYDDENSNNIYHLSHQLNELKNKLMFDLICIEKIPNFEIIHQILESLSSSILPNGYLIITDTRPIYLHESVYPKPNFISSNYWIGDSWKVTFF